ncbi:hypothetical protein, partial [Geomicrobium halophilum]|uniref:hypothetical protein n=1 Tax=Geomicrobium halophilum TaxID=549000 RepID=UPI001C871923
MIAFRAAESILYERMPRSTALPWHTFYPQLAEDTPFRRMIPLFRRGDAVIRRELRGIRRIVRLFGVSAREFG